jgi:hypothetical protein
MCVAKLPLEKAEIATLAACVPHSMIQEKERAISDIHKQFLSLQADLYESRTVQLVRPSTTARNVCMQRLKYFHSDTGSIPWQNKYAHCIDVTAVYR